MIPTEGMDSSGKICAKKRRRVCVEGGGGAHNSSPNANKTSRLYYTYNIQLLLCTKPISVVTVLEFHTVSTSCMDACHDVNS